MLVDWAGDALEVINGNTGAPWLLQQFVAILGASQLTYVEARESQDEENWIRANKGALRYWGGVPRALIPDNTKTAVVRADPYESGLNPVFDDFARHFAVVIMPTRVRRPQDKAPVEGAVRLVYQRISSRLRGKVFSSLAQVNEAIRELLKEHNSRAFSRLPYSRRELFQEVERPALRPLPVERLMLKSTAEATVQVNYHVELRTDRHYYSVPFHLRHRDPPTRVKIVYDDRVVAIYWDNVRVAQHRRDRSPNGYTTLAEHMPPHHRWYAEWSTERFLSWARTIGEETEQLIAKVLAAAAYPPQAFRSCLGILNLTRDHGSQRLNAACGKALRVGTQSYRRIKNILELGVQQENHPLLDLGPPVFVNVVVASTCPPAVEAVDVFRGVIALWRCSVLYQRTNPTTQQRASCRLAKGKDGYSGRYNQRTKQRLGVRVVVVDPRPTEGRHDPIDSPRGGGIQT